MPTIVTNGVDLYYETHGEAADPAVLLVMGLGTQLIAWPEAFIEGLVAAGFHVIAFDNRDVGHSTHLHGAVAVHPLRAMLAAGLGMRFPLAYSLEDMARDALGLLDALGIERAHLVGASMGGMIAQIIAAIAPPRVLSLTSVMSSSGRRGLPGPSPELRKRLLARRPRNASREQLIAMGAESLKAIAYPDSARSPDAFQTMAKRAFERGYNPTGMRRQLLAILADGSRVDRLKRITAPSLVIHGAADQLVPLACSEDIAVTIPGARLEVIDAMAHDLPPSQLPRVTGLILDHLAARAS